MMRFIKDHGLFVGLLLIFAAMTLYNAATLPLGEAADETDHYQYLRFVARTGHPPLTEDQRREAGFKGGLAPLYYGLVAWPVAWVGEDAQPDIRRVDARPERFIPTDGLGINRSVHTLDEAYPWQGQPLAWHLVRFLSLPMAILTLLATYLLAGRLFPARRDIALGAVIFMMFLPRFVISSAVINDDNLIFALMAWLLLVEVLILQGHHRPRLFVGLGVLLGLSLLTKYFALILVFEVALVLGWYAYRYPQHARRNLMVFGIALLLTAGPWFGFIAWQFNRIADLGLIPGLAASLGEPQITEGLVGLLSGEVVRPPAATYGLLEWSGLLYGSFWFEYGWMQLFAPRWVYALLTVWLVVPLWAAMMQSNAIKLNPVTSVLVTRLGLFVGVVLMRYILSATIDTGQGRHLYPALPVIALAVGVGLAAILQQAHRLQLAAVGIGGVTAIVLSAGASFWLAPHYPVRPVTIATPAALDITYPQQMPLGEGISFAGYDAPTEATAGESLPVTLYWHTESEVQRDYFVSLCLQDPQRRPVGCWRGQFADGQYPSRAWESGDTLIDTVHIPLPACDRLIEQQHHLQLEVWPLALDTPDITRQEPPVLQATLTHPPIVVNSGSQSPVNTLWRSDERLTGWVDVQPRQTLAFIYYDDINPAFDGGSMLWQPLLRTRLHPPCDDAPSSPTVAHFSADLSLRPRIYEREDLYLRYQPRSRRLSPITTTLTFADTLAPLTVQVAHADAISVTATPSNETPRIVRPGERLPITIDWQTVQSMADPLVIALKLLDKDFAVAGERVATLGDRYPNVLWLPTERINETYPVPIRGDAPPGLYLLEVSLLRQNAPDSFANLPARQNGQDIGANLYPLRLRIIDPAHDTPLPASPLAQIGQNIRLRQYALSSKTVSPGDSLDVTLFWTNTAPLTESYTVFTQLLGPDGRVWAQWDNPPQGGRYPTTAWTGADTVVDRYTLTLPVDAPPGTYRLLVGMYDPQTGARLPVTVNGEPQPDNAIQVTLITVE